MSLVLFEVTAAESAGLPADVRSRVRLEPRTLHERARDHPECEMAIVEVRSRVGTAELERLPRLRAVVSRTAGLDHIDLGACAERGVVVTHAGDYSSGAVAEFTIAFLLHLLRGRQIRRSVSGGLGEVSGSLGGELSGRTVGVIGLGGIGRRVAAVLVALGCDVLAVSRRPLEGIESVPLARVLEPASVMTLHLPGEAGLVLGPDEFLRLKAGALVVTDHVAWATEAAFERQLRCVIEAVRGWEG
ncbi:MAG: hypothetical protein KKA32_03615 [Actinobacteria bacterium]|nr:hypothetical protein [Actinomycetota bacterium]